MSVISIIRSGNPDRRPPEDRGDRRHGQGRQQVVDAKATGTLFRGFETILANRDPRDAPHITQRICGVCPVSHGMAAVLALDRPPA